MQTAVIDSAESEIPALLPMQADQARAFRQAHAGQTFWCGQWLGGCRGRLTIRTPPGRVAHFAHLPEPEHVVCRSASVGVSGADHLYIKQQLLAWLVGQGIATTTRLPEDTEPLGSEVVFEPGGHGCGTWPRPQHARRSATMTSSTRRSSALMAGRWLWRVTRGRSHCGTWPPER
ncbi:competence protein CoiA family protein [Streptomyces sp. NPDC056464]|uniref:competence protein CoiA family protein n=1 Tax=Streptomyces sp. NPDC056464 TaxID=3345828 RepID=UPI003679625D